MHGLQEFVSILPLLKSGDIVIIDDTPADLTYCPSHVYDNAKKYFDEHGLIPGKGMYVDLLLSKSPKFENISHQYQVIYKVI